MRGWGEWRKREMKESSCGDRIDRSIWEGLSVPAVGGGNGGWSGGAGGAKEGEEEGERDEESVGDKEEE